MANLVGRRICASKTGYTEEHAQHVVDMALWNRKVMLRKYQCLYCDKWHVTSKSPQNYKKRREFWREAGETKTARSKRNFFLDSDGTCFYCGDELTVNTFTIDHVIPRSSGGINHRFNKLVSCYDCNQLRRDMPFLEFLEFIGWDFAVAIERDAERQRLAKQEQYRVINRRQHASY